MGNPFAFKLLGGCVLAGPDGLVAGRAAQRRRLAVLALVAAGGRSGVARDRVVALLWPDTEPEQARRLLTDTLYVIRAALGADALTAVGDRIALNVDAVACDALAFEDALQRGDHATAVATYAGPFLDSFHVPDAPEFSRWADAERERLERAYTGALEALARGAAERGDRAGAASLWRRHAAARPYDGRVARCAAEALDAAGDRAGAIAHLQLHAALLRQDLDVAPDAELLALAARFRAPPPASELPSGPAEPPAPTAPATAPAASAPVPAAPLASAPSAPARGAPARRLTRAARAALVGTLGALVLALAAWGARRREPEFAERRVVVAPFVNETGDTAFAALGRMAADWITQGLSGTGLAEVVPTTAAFAAARYVDSVGGRGAGDRARRIADETGAGLVVSGAVYRVGDSVQLRAEVTDPHRGRVLRALDPIAAPAHAPMPAVASLRRHALGALAPLLDERLANTASLAGAPPSYEVYREFTEGIRLITGGDFRAAHVHVARAAALDSTYLTALVWLALTSSNIGQWPACDSLTRRLAAVRGQLAPYDAAVLDNVRAWVDEDWAAAYAAASRAARIAPGSMAAVQVAFEGLRIGRPREAARILEALDPTRGELRGYWAYWMALDQAYHQLGRYDDELRAARGMRALRPDDPTYLDFEARALAGLGRTDEALALIDVRLGMPWERGRGSEGTMFLLANELRAHGHRAAERAVLGRFLAWLDARAPGTQGASGCRACRAEVLEWMGRARESRAIFAALVAEDSANRRALRGLGITAAQTGDRATAERASARLAALVARGGRRVGVVLLDRALIAAHLGDRAGAMALLQEAVARGVPPVFGGARFHDEPEFDPLRDYPPFVALTRPQG